MNTLAVICIIAGVCGVAIADVSIKINKLFKKVIQEVKSRAFG